MRAFVTGGSGFVGSNLARRLLADGHEVTATCSPGENRMPEGVQILYSTFAGINWEKTKGHDVCFHQAANNDTRCWDEEEMLKANAKDTCVLLKRLHEGGCKRFVVASSTAVYGNAPVPHLESTEDLRPMNRYAESKLFMETMLALYLQEHPDISIVSLRYCNVYGPGEDHKGSRMSMIGQIIRRILDGETVKLFTDGTQQRDWVHVDDVVQANLLAAKGPSGVYNVGSGTCMSFNLIVKTVVDILKLKSRWTDHIEYIENPFIHEYQGHTLCAIEKACNLLGYTPSYTIKSGIEDYLKHLIGSCSCSTLARLSSSVQLDSEGRSRCLILPVVDVSKS